MNIKKCFKCEIIKNLDDFYVHKKMGDGHLNKCKECTKKDCDKREKQLRSDPIWCEKERLRSQEKYYRLNYRERQFESNKNKPWKTSLYKGLHKNLNLNKELNAHHWNYNILDQVIIVDSKVHRKIHTRIVFDLSLKIFKTKEGILLDTLEKHLDYLKDILVEYEIITYSPKQKVV